MILTKSMGGYENYLYVCMCTYLWVYVNIFAKGKHKLWLTEGSVLTISKGVNWEGHTFSYKIEKP